MQESKLRIFTLKGGEKLKTFSVCLPETMVEEINGYAEKARINRQEVIRQMLQHCLDDLVTTSVVIGGSGDRHNL